MLCGSNSRDEGDGGRREVLPQGTPSTGFTLVSSASRKAERFSLALLTGFPEDSALQRAKVSALRDWLLEVESNNISATTSFLEGLSFQTDGWTVFFWRKCCTCAQKWPGARPATQEKVGKLDRRNWQKCCTCAQKWPGAMPTTQEK